MAGTEESMAKICLMCGTDCTNKPRIKDAKGNYYCKACADKVGAKKAGDGGDGGAPAAKAAAKPAVPGAPSEQNIMAKLVDQSLSQAAGACPACRKKLKEGAVICTHCGFNTTTGQMVQTAVQKPDVVVDKSSPKARRRVKIDPSAIVLVALVVLGGLLAGALMEPNFVPVAYGAIGVFSLVLQIMTIIAAFQDDHKGWGILGIVNFFVPCLGLLILYYMFAVTERDYLKALWIVNVLAAIMLVFVVYMTGVDPREMLGGN